MIKKQTSQVYYNQYSSINSTLKVNWLRINFYLAEGFNSELINAFNGVIAADELAAKRSG